MAAAAAAAAAAIKHASVGVVDVCASAKNAGRCAQRKAAKWQRMTTTVWRQRWRPTADGADKRMLATAPQMYR
jgi:ClpP class serine protease